MDSFTPGPWKVADASYGWDHFAAIVQTKPGGQLIGTCHLAALSRDYTQSAADARLIAAAPDLLDALENLLIGIGMGWDLAGLIAVAQTAGAKARGLSQDTGVGGNG